MPFCVCSILLLVLDLADTVSAKLIYVSSKYSTQFVLGLLKES